MHIYGNFDGFDANFALFGLVILAGSSHIGSDS